jgi:hypothetical protein
MILGEPSETMEGWREHLQNMLTNPDTVSTEISQELGEGSGNEREEIEEKLNENEAPKIGEVKKAVERLKSNRSPAPGNTTAELLKAKQEATEVTVQRTGCQVWKAGIVPAHWGEGLVCPSHKKETNWN